MRWGNEHYGSRPMTRSTTSLRRSTRSTSTGWPGTLSWLNHDRSQNISNPPQTAQFHNIRLHHSPTAAERLRPKARRMAPEMVNNFIERGECDFVAELTNPLLANLILHMLRVDEAEYWHRVTCVHVFAGWTTRPVAH